MFKLNSINVGNIMIGTTKTVEFPYEKGVNITSLVASCDCTSAYDNKEKNKVVVKYQPKPVPIHLKQQNYNNYAFVKEVKVIFIFEGEALPKETVVKFYGVAIEYNN